MKEPHKVASFVMPVSLHVPIHQLDDARVAINRAITGSEDPISIKDPDGRFTRNPKFDRFDAELSSAHWRLNASHTVNLDVAVYSDGSLGIEYKEKQ